MTKVSHSHMKFASSYGSSDWKNVYILSFFAFVDAFQFAFFVWSFYPYVKQLDPSTSASFVGLIMAFSGIGEALSAPILGFWTNRTGHVVPPLLFSVALSLFGNISYMCLNKVPTNWRTLLLLFSRFLSGSGSGNRGVYFAYIAAATTQEDRTRAMALSGGGALIGLNIGPAVQMAFTWIGEDGFDFAFMRFSTYTAPAILAIFINLLCIILLAFCLEDGLDRFNLPDADTHSSYSIAAASDSDLERNTVNIIRVDVLAIAVCMGCRAARMLMTGNIEATGSAYSELMFNLPPQTSLQYNSYMQAAVGILTTLMFFVYVFTPYPKWISERLNCLWAMFALLLFHLLTFSWPFLPGKLEGCDRFNGNDSSHNWNWCYELKPVSASLFYVSYSLIYGISLPCLNNSLQSLFSQVLGKGRQGLMQGLNQAIGCISRILGPILMSSSFSFYGPRATWLIEIVLILLCIVVFSSTYRRLQPSVVIKERSITVSEQIDGVINPTCLSQERK